MNTWRLQDEVPGKINQRFSGSQSATDKRTERQGCQPRQKTVAERQAGFPASPSRAPSTTRFFLRSRKQNKTKARTWRAPELEEGVPIWDQGPQHIPPSYLRQMGGQMCGLRSPRRPPPWEPGLELSFSHLHERLGALSCSHPSVGPPLAIWSGFMTGWPDPGGRKNDLESHPREPLQPSLS